MAFKHFYLFARFPPVKDVVSFLERNTDLLLKYPNENYQVFFPDAVLPEELPEAYRSCALRIGAYAIIDHVPQEYKLPQMLEKHFGKDCGLLLDLVAYLIVNEENAGQHYPDFAFNHSGRSDLQDKGQQEVLQREWYPAVGSGTWKS